MKKTSMLLTFVLVMALAAPVFAAEDNVEVTGTVDTVFETAGYGDNADATTTLWADGDALDLDNPVADKDGDEDDFPAKKAFYQEIDFGVAGTVNENITFDLAVDTLVNSFTTTEGPAYDADADGTDTILGGQGDSNDLLMDSALLTLNKGVSTLKLGDINDFHGDVYFVDEEDLEGTELTTAIAGSDVRAFMVSESEDADFKEKDYYGVTVARDLGAADVTGKLYQARENGESVTDLAVSAEVAVNDMVTVNGEIVSSDNSKADSDTLITIGTDVAVNDAVTVNAGYESAGEDFTSVAGDLEEDADYDLMTVGADYVLNTNNTVKGSYTVVTPGDVLGATNDEDKSTLELSLDNTMGAFTNTASIELVTNDSYTKDNDTTVITLGTEYDVSEATTASASLTNKSGDQAEFNYLTAGLDTKVSENVNWNTEAKLIDGTTEGDEDGKGSALTTKLSVNF
ncbi:hypothetical protein JCM16358_13120 [Halanaerocella petrolearia]